MSKFELIAAAIALGVASLTCAAVESSPKCKDQDGQDVDWFIVYKLPRMQPHKGNFMRPEGGEFVYVDARNSKESLRWWPLSSQDLFEPDNPVAFTLAPLYENTTGKASCSSTSRQAFGFCTAYPDSLTGCAAATTVFPRMPGRTRKC